VPPPASISERSDELTASIDLRTIAGLDNADLATALHINRRFTGHAQEIGQAQMAVQQSIAVTDSNNQYIGAHELGLQISYFYFDLRTGELTPAS
jgi:hypothetical protein